MPLEQAQAGAHPSPQVSIARPCHRGFFLPKAAQEGQVRPGFATQVIFRPLCKMFGFYGFKVDIWVCYLFYHLDIWISVILTHATSGLLSFQWRILAIEQAMSKPITNLHHFKEAASKQLMFAFGKICISDRQTDKGLLKTQIQAAKMFNVSIQHYRQWTIFSFNRGSTITSMWIRYYTCTGVSTHWRKGSLWC